MMRKKYMFSPSIFLSLRCGSELSLVRRAIHRNHSVIAHKLYNEPQAKIEVQGDYLRADGPPAAD
jgi:hypothetical protein